MSAIIPRPRMMDKPVEIYDHEFSKYPDRIRVLFMDGHTEIYDIRREQPHPLVLKNIEIMESTARNIKQGYVNQPARRRRRK